MDGSPEALQRTLERAKANKTGASAADWEWLDAKFYDLKIFSAISKEGQDAIEASADIRDLKRATEDSKTLVNDFLLLHSSLVKNVRSAASTLRANAAQAKKRCTQLAEKVEKAKAKMNAETEVTAGKRRRITPTIPSVFERRWEGCHSAVLTEAAWKDAVHKGELDLDVPFRLSDLRSMKDLCASDAELNQKMTQFLSDCGARAEVMSQGRGQRVVKKQEIRDALADVVPTKAQRQGACRISVDFATVPRAMRVRPPAPRNDDRGQGLSGRVSL